MSTLTADTRVGFVPVLYDTDGKEVEAGIDCPDEDTAIEVAEEMVADYVNTYNKWCHATIELRIVPVYK